MKKLIFFLSAFLLFQNLFSQQIKTKQPLYDYLGQSLNSKDIKELIKSAEKKVGPLEEDNYSDTSYTLFVRDMGEIFYLEFSRKNKEDKKPKLVEIFWRPEYKVMLTSQLEVPVIDKFPDIKRFILNNNAVIYDNKVLGSVINNGAILSSTKKGFILSKKDEEQLKNVVKVEDYVATNKEKMLFPVVSTENGFSYIGPDTKSGWHILETTLDNGLKLTYHGELEEEYAHGHGRIDYQLEGYSFAAVSFTFVNGTINGTLMLFYENKDLNLKNKSKEGLVVNNIAINPDNFKL